MNRDKIIAQLKTDEGLKLVPYFDSLGYLTIGYGHRGLLGVVMVQGGISQTYAEQLLSSDVDIHVAGLDHAMPWWRGMNDARQDAFVNMGFNLGVHKLLTFDIFLDLMKAANYNGAADDLTTTLWHKQVGARGPRIENVIRSGVD